MLEPVCTKMVTISSKVREDALGEKHGLYIISIPNIHALEGSLADGIGSNFKLKMLKILKESTAVRRMEYYKQGEIEKVGTSFLTIPAKGILRYLTINGQHLRCIVTLLTIKCLKNVVPSSIIWAAIAQGRPTVLAIAE